MQHATPAVAHHGSVEEQTGSRPQGRGKAGRDMPVRGRAVSTVVTAVLVAAVSAALVAGCSGPRVTPPPPPRADVVVRSDVTVAKAAAPVPLPDLSTLPVIDPLNIVPGLPGTDGLQPLRNEDPTLGTWQTVVVARDTPGYTAPGGTVVGVVPQVTLSIATTLPVIDARPGWVRVLVATRGALPSQDRAQVNGRSAWVLAADTVPSGTDWSVHVDTAAQTLTVTTATGTQTFPVKATGKAATPTPGGLSFLLGARWLQPGTTTPRVLPLSTQSETIDHYDKPTGTAVTAIHTTTLSGRGEVSNGCVRVADDVIDLLWQAPGGTVVTVG